MADGASIRSNADQVGAALAARTSRLMPRVMRAVMHAALMVQTRTQANASLPASGPPGPRAITGDYRGSWGVTQPTVTSGGFAATVATNKPQARRLEYGFVGVDARGRHYNQRPYPHLRPAVEATEPEFQAALRAAVQED
jgi:hypothetical protein